ncbi:MAG: patatin-like phospholipase family protein [Bacillota bacterium]
MIEPRIGLALGGGAARGLAHLGVFQVLEENNIPIHYLAGTSAGALMGALYAGGLDPRYLEKLAEHTSWAHLARLTVPRRGLVATGKLETFINTLLQSKSFDQLRIPLAVTAVDLKTGRLCVIQEGNVARAVRASSSIPGIFEPLAVGDMLLVDGGVRQSVPISVCRSMGAQVVIAVDLNSLPSRSVEPHSIFQVILLSLDILQREAVENDLKEADILVQPDLSQFSPADLDHVAEIVEAGRRATEAKLPEIRAAIKRWQVPE